MKPGRSGSALPITESTVNRISCGTSISSSVTPKALRMLMTKKSTLPCRKYKIIVALLNRPFCCVPIVPPIYLSYDYAYWREKIGYVQDAPHFYIETFF